jgi:hypothetical protein
MSDIKHYPCMRALRNRESDLSRDLKKGIGE